MLTLKEAQKKMGTWKNEGSMQADHKVCANCKTSVLITVHRKFRFNIKAKGLILTQRLDSIQVFTLSCDL